MRLVQVLGLAFAAFAMAVNAQVVEPVTELEIRFDGGDRDPLNAAAIDIEGNFYLTGGRGNSAGTTSNTYYLAKYDSFGREQWTRVYATGRPSWFGQSNNLVVDRDGNVFMALSESYHFGSIVKFDRDGNEQVIASGGSVPYAWEHRVGLALDGDGNLFLRAANFVEKYDAAGALQWRQRFLTHYATWTRDVKVDDAGNLYVVGRGWDSATSTNNAVVAKFDPQGTVLWSYRYQPGVQSEAQQALFDAQGNLLVLAQEVNASGNWDVALITLTPDGTLLASQRHDSGGNDLPKDMAMDELGNAYVLSDAGQDFLTAKYAPDGTQLWSVRYDSGTRDHPAAIAVDVFGSAYVTGSRGFNFYARQIVTLKYDTDGLQEWIKKETTGNGYAGFVEPGRTGEVYVAGSTIGVYDAVLYGYRICPGGL